MDEPVHRFDGRLRPNPNGGPHVTSLWNRLAGLLYRREWLDAHGQDIESINGEIHQTRRRLLRHGVGPLELEMHIADIADEARHGIEQMLGEDQ
jgi:hypothetical protein